MEIEEVWDRGIAEAARKLWSVNLQEPRFQPLLEPPSDPKFGDATSGIAFRLAKDLKKPPRAIAEELAKEVRGLPHVERAEVAGAGYVNFHAATAYYGELIQRIRAEAANYGCSEAGAGRRVLVEHCSANPTGPLHIAHGRQAAVGDTLANILDFAGYRVDREFYVNDTGNQVEMFGRSIHARLQELLGRPAPLNVEEDKNAYKGEYVRELARELATTEPEADPNRCARFGLERQLAEIKKDLEAFRVRYDTWYSEEALRKSGKVDRIVEEFKKRGLTFVHEGALMLRATEFGHDKDDVLLKSDGSFAYRTPDIAYHLDKFDRWFERAIDLLGPDHHEHIQFLKRVLKALGREDFHVLSPQHCRVLRGGQEVKMSKRAGSYITLRELMDEVGVDATRYFFIMRKVNSHLDFDIDVAKKQSLDNPVYYAQYAHARICGIFEQGRVKGMIAAGDDGAFDASRLAAGEIELLRAARGLRRSVEAAARDLDPALLTDFVYRLSGAFQRYYQKFENTVLTSDEPLRRARLAVCGAVRQVLRNSFGILGVSAPERL